MSDPTLVPLLVTLGIRMLIVVAVVAAASVAIERAGPLAGAMIATLPISAGPAYVFLALDHDAAFIAESATASLLSIAATSAFQLTYIAVAGRAGTAMSLAAALAGWAAALALLLMRQWHVAQAFGLVLAINTLAIAATGAVRKRRSDAAVSSRIWHLVVRTAAVVLVVFAVTVAGRLLGPRAAGLSALLPVVFTSLVLILQPSLGGPAVAAVIANSFVGMIGMALALAALNLSATTLGSGLGLALALTICLGWNGLVLAGRSVWR